MEDGPPRWNRIARGKDPQEVQVEEHRCRADMERRGIRGRRRRGWRPNYTCFSVFLEAVRADGARSGPLAVQRQACFPASVARGPPRITHISGSRPTRKERKSVSLEDVPRPDRLQGSRFRPRGRFTTRSDLSSLHSPSTRRRPTLAHEAGTRVSREREGSDRSLVPRLDAPTASCFVLLQHASPFDNSISKAARSPRSIGKDSNAIFLSTLRVG